MDIELPSNQIPNDIEEYLSNYTRTNKIPMCDPFEKHENLYKLSKIELYVHHSHYDQPFGHRNDLELLFAIIATLCDPYTQPYSVGESNEFILSIDFISNLVIVLNQDTDWFDVCINLSKIIERITILLNCYDSYELPSIDDISHETLLRDLSKWTPKKILYQSQLSSKCHDLKLLYSMVSVCFYTIGNIYKNYLHKGNVSLNPFLSFFLKYWKTQTHIIILGLEFDRYCENNNIECPSDEYPEIIRYVIKGSATIRTVLAIILNDDMDVEIHDLKHESLKNFCSPWGRKTSCGALTCDMRLYVSSMLSLGCDLLHVTSLIINLEPDDKYDEDINYVFDYELDEQEQETIDVYQDEMGKFVSVDERSYELHPDCKCGFDEDDEEEDDAPQGIEQDNGEEDDEDEGGVIHYKFSHEDGSETAFYQNDGKLYNSKTKELINEDEFLMNANPIFNRWQKLDAERNNEDLIDESGNDWRDIPRGENRQLSNKFVEKLFDPRNFYNKWDEVEKAILMLSTEVCPVSQGDKLIYTVARAIVRETELSKGDNSLEISPDLLYKSICQNFSKMSLLNPVISYKLIDEMMMCEGYRRVIIWFLTHLELSYALCEYIHDLILGNRVIFSRMGKLELSQIEKMMLIHEFLTNSTVFLSRGTMVSDVDITPLSQQQHKYIASPLEARKLIKVICQMLKSFYAKGILISGDDEFRNELQALLLQWVSIIDEAKEIYNMC